MYSQLKTFIKFVMRLVGGMLVRRRELSPEISLIGDDSWDTFYGYFDRSIFSDGNIILSKVSLCGKGSKISVVSINTHELIFEQGTRVFNYQQANQQQWFSSDVFGFVDEVSGGLATYVVDVNSGRSHVIPYPLQVKISDRSFISIDYSKFNDCAEDYAYPTGKQQSSSVELVEFSVDGADFKYTSCRMFSLDDVVKFLNVKGGKKHHLNHFIYRKEDHSVIFIFRYYDVTRTDVLLSFSLRTNEFRVVLDTSFVSHFCLVEGRELLVYGKHGENEKSGYFLVNLDTLLIAFDSPFSSLKRDGHPVAVANYMVTDTYPSMFNFQTLFLYDRSSEVAREYEIYHPNVYNTYYRCDLHPCIDDVEDVVFVNMFDSGEKRSVGFVRLNEVFCRDR